VIFHSYVSLPEGIQCWKSSTTQVSQAPRTTKQPPSKNLQHWHHPNGRPKYIWVPMNIPNCFFYIPLVFPMQSIADIYWGHFSMQIPNSNSHHSLLKYAEVFITEAPFSRPQMLKDMQPHVIPNSAGPNHLTPWQRLMVAWRWTTPSMEDARTKDGNMFFHSPGSMRTKNIWSLIGSGATYLE
jgi:hypothetical protein